MSVMWKYLAAGLLALAVVAGLLEMGYRQGWEAHSAKVNNDYKAKQDKAIILQTKNTQKAAQAEQVGSVEYREITKEVIKYVARPNPVKCEFDSDRVRIKQRSVTNANRIPGYDD